VHIDVHIFQKNIFKKIWMNLVLKYNWHETAVFTKHKHILLTWEKSWKYSAFSHVIWRGFFVNTAVSYQIYSNNKFILIYFQNIFFWKRSICTHPTQPNVRHVKFTWNSREKIHVNFTWNSREKIHVKRASNVNSHENFHVKFTWSSREFHVNFMWSY
jgi:hypothetical protein